MRKYMKYEIKGSYKIILGIIAMVLIASTIIQVNISGQIKLDSADSANTINGFGTFMLVVSISVIFGAFLTAFFQIIGSFRKELYEDRGYLTFTLPLTGNEILGAKLLVAITWFLVLGISIVAYNLLLGALLYGSQWTNFINSIRQIIGNANIEIFSIAMVSLLSAIVTLILIYFSMALSRVNIRNKKIGGLWFIIFIVLNSLVSYFIVKIVNALPYFLSLDSFKILHSYELNFLPRLGNIAKHQIILFGNNFDVYINVFGILSMLIIGISAFLATGYLIEKKIDL
ncbi:hypothetical protein SAMN02745784_03046 [Tissierella praeacuta DSM 18095]|uniref:ABC-2 family transporter protein n=1 Tax=Tissierella praeacuta DSM 18095 TaxID=1123404 RepID=A0A1M4ZGW5_9FIRM|nr:hypothetical protein [Tissierella praeacuta]TCU74183.1 hypothetical protein EV204_104221 [Tissierella praeacuta]SHF17283.1 hypothetical protein SAMN02745784_03046 [Tissierella praeacuta DSM 18095]SUP03134.1 Uncharacterised protein [Tissierella praeacuta]